LICAEINEPDNDCTNNVAAIRKEASTLPHPIKAAVFFEILRKPNPLIINPMSGKNGIRVASCNIF
jgi:hypothetical protein